MKLKNFLIVFLAVAVTTITVASVGGFSTVSEYFDSLGGFNVNDEIQRTNLIEGELSGADEVRSDILNAKFAAFNKKLDLAAASSTLNCNDIYYNSTLCGASNNCQSIAWNHETNSEEQAKPAGYCVDACTGGKIFQKGDGQFPTNITSVEEATDDAICQCPYGSLTLSGQSACFIGSNGFTDPTGACGALTDETTCNAVGLANASANGYGIGNPDTNGIEYLGAFCSWDGSSCNPVSGGTVVCENISDQNICEQESTCYLAENGTDPDTGDFTYGCATINNCEDIITDISTESGAGNSCGEGFKVDSNGLACFDDISGVNNYCIYQPESCQDLDEFSCGNVPVASGDTCFFDYDFGSCEVE